MTSPTSSPAAKRIKLEDLTPTHFDVEPNEYRGDNLETADAAITEDNPNPIEEDEDENHCSICLHSVVDRTVIPKCSHEFCFECLLVWTEQSRRCPLCSQAIGEYLIHSIRSRYDYRKHYLSPLRTSPPPSRPAQTSMILQTTRQNATRRRRERNWGAQGSHVREHEEFDKLERSITKRRWIYQHDLYAKHVASNSYTKYRPYPTPSQFTNSQELISRTTTFLRRELQVWEGLDVEFLTNLIISLMKAIDIRSESAVKLISEFLDMDEPYTPGGRHRNAEHFAHEVYCYVRSPYRDLFVYDTIVQYDLPPELTPPPDLERSRRWYPSSPPRSVAGPSQEYGERRLRSRSKSSERGGSWSPSRRQYLSTRNKAPVNEPVMPASKNTEHVSHQRVGKMHRQDKGPQHRSSISDDEILLPVKNRTWEKDGAPMASSSKIMTSSSSNKNVKHMPFGVDRTKGKGKAHAMESPNSVMEHDISEPTKSTPDAEPDEQDIGLAPPDGKHVQKDVQQGVEQKSVPSRPTRLRALRPPRNSSLLDSVKAHLSGNSRPTNPDRMILPPPTQQRSANTNALTNVSAISSNHIDMSSAPDTQAQSLSTRRQGETRFVDISRADSRGSNVNISDTRHTRVRSVRGSIFDPSRFPAPRPSNISGQKTALLTNDTDVVGETSLRSTPEIDASTKRERQINARNSAHSTKVISDAHEPTSSSKLNNVQYHDFCAAGAISSKEVPSSKFSPKISFRKIPPAQTTNHDLSHPTRVVDDPAEAERRSPNISGNRQKGIGAAHDVPLDPEIPGKDHSPIRKEDGFKDADAITFVNHSTDSTVPHAIKTRTRLLARLEFEKKQACAPGLQNDADVLALQEESMSASSSFIASSVHMDVDAPGSKDDGCTQAPPRPETCAESLNAYRYAQSDPDGGYAEEEARVREARLRARVQLKARLAAEKRKVGGS